jgi:hypothetical protein
MQDPPVNAALKHKYALGSVVEVDVELYSPGSEASIEVSLKGTCRLVVVGHMRDCDETPLYVLSDLAVKYPIQEPVFSQDAIHYKFVATLVEFGYGEDSLRPTGETVLLMDSMGAWFKVEE